MRHFFVINPHSFRKSPGKLEQVLRDINNCFSAVVHISRYPRDAISVIHHYIKATSPEETVRVYAVGGDGILFDCVNGIVEFPNAELTAIPYGNSNDFVRSFGEDAPKKFRILDNLHSVAVHSVDLIKCGSNYAINSVAFGLEGQAVSNAYHIFRNPRLKLLSKYPGFVYKLCAIGAIFNDEVIRQEYRVLLDGEDVSGKYYNISISNTPCIGGTMISCPYAKPNDGILEGIFSECKGIFDVLKSIGDYTSGHYEKNKNIFRKQFKKMEIESNNLIRVHMDGEIFCTEKLTLEIIPGHIKFFAPKGMDFADYSYRAYAKKKGGR